MIQIDKEPLSHVDPGSLKSSLSAFRIVRWDCYFIVFMTDNKLTIILPSLKSFDLLNEYFISSNELHNMNKHFCSHSVCETVNLTLE